MDADTARQRSRSYAGLAHAFSQAEPGLEKEYTRLFLGPGRPVAHPYESVYREGRTMGRTTLDVRSQLVEEGLAPEGRTLPDHIGIELAFVAHLAAREALAWEAGDLEGGRACMLRQEAFLRDHLLMWLPQFCRRVLVGRPHAHYEELARHAEAFVTADSARVQAWLGPGPGASANAVTERESWSVAVGRGCTMCDVCVQVCRPGALQRVLHRELGEVALRLDATMCDGCAACQQWCPEEVIQVGRVPNGQRPPIGELARSAMLTCPQCGQFHAPAAMLAKVQAHMGPGDARFAQRLALCQGCKARDIPLRRASAGAA